MKTKFTPGPWKVISKNAIAKRITTNDGHPIADTFDRNCEANAQLIAAAPEMLALLEEVSKLIDHDASGGQTYDSYVYASGVQTKIDKVISKARGES